MGTVNSIAKENTLSLMDLFKATTNVDPVTIQVVIYHNPCQDGYSAAFVALFHLVIKLGLKLELIPSYISDDIDLEKVAGKNVLMVDIVSPNFKEIKAAAKSLVILDHHRTNEEDLKDIPYAYFDMNKSGVGLAWEYFSQEPIPLFLACVQDRDIWTWKIPESRCFCDGLQALVDFSDKEFVILKELMIDEKKFGEIYEVGKILNQLKMKRIRSIAPIDKPERNRVTADVKGTKYTIYIYNITESDLVSDLGNHVATKFKCDFVVMWKFSHTDNEYFYSLRSIAEKTDVSRIAELFGGGGHKAAAGMATKEHPNIVFSL